MNKPITLITGASRGIGRSLAEQVADQGHHVIAMARTVGALEELADKIGDDHVTLIPQDLKDGQTLENLGPHLHDKFGVIDEFNVVLNAGMLGTLCPLDQTDPKQWHDIMTVNVTANLHLIRTLHPLITKAKKARVVFVTSSVAKHPHAYWGAYAISKAALENMAAIYEQETAGHNVNVHIFDPGGTATRMRASAFPGENPETLPSADETAHRLAALIL